jgi:hypothetical protein
VVPEKKLVHPFKTLATIRQTHFAVRTAACNHRHRPRKLRNQDHYNASSEYPGFKEIREDKILEAKLSRREAISNGISLRMIH